MPYANTHQSRSIQACFSFGSFFVAFQAFRFFYLPDTCTDLTSPIWLATTRLIGVLVFAVAVWLANTMAEARAVVNPSPVPPRLKKLLYSSIAALAAQIILPPQIASEGGYQALGWIYFLVLFRLAVETAKHQDTYSRWTRHALALAGMLTVLGFSLKSTESTQYSFFRFQILQDILWSTLIFIGLRWKKRK